MGLGINMNEERKCPFFYDTKLHKVPRCNGKIIRMEPLFSSEKRIGSIRGPKDIRGSLRDDGFTNYFIYECENGHVLNRPEGWADVRKVPAGTIKTKSGIVNRPYLWYAKLSEKEKEREDKNLKKISR